MQRFGQSFPQPRDGLGPGKGRQLSAGRRFGGPDLAARLQCVVYRVKQRLTGVGWAPGTANRLNEVEQRSAGQILHVQQPPVPVAENPLVEDPDDVIVIKLGEGLWFVAA